MRNAWKSWTIRLLFAGMFLVTVVSAHDPWWVSSYSPDDDTDFLNDPNDNGEVTTLLGLADGSGASGPSSASLNLWADADVILWAEVDESSNMPPESAGSWGWGWGYVTGHITWEGEPGEGGNRTCDFTTHSHGEANGEAAAVDLTNGGYAWASADSESASIADSDGASGYGEAEYSDYAWYTGTGSNGGGGHSDAYVTRVTGTIVGVSYASGEQSWRWYENKEKAEWTISLSGTITNITGGTLSAMCYAEAEAESKTRIDPGEYGDLITGGADADAWASADVTMNLH